MQVHPQPLKEQSKGECCGYFCGHRRAHLHLVILASYQRQSTARCVQWSIIPSSQSAVRSSVMLSRETTQWQGRWIHTFLEYRRIYVPLYCIVLYCVYCILGYYHRQLLRRGNCLVFVYWLRAVVSHEWPPSLYIFMYDALRRSPSGSASRALMWPDPFTSVLNIYA